MTTAATAASSESEPANVSWVRDGITELVMYRELVASLVRRELLIRYKYAPLGIAWALLLPLVTAAVFSVVFTRLAPLNVGVPYPLFAFTGLLAWHLSASAVRAAAGSLAAHGSLITKIYFPREVLPLSAVMVALSDYAVGMVLLGILLVAYGVPPSGWLLFLPVVLVIQLTLTTALALVVAMGALMLRDLRQLIDVALTLGMYLTAVLYPVDRVAASAGALLALNPMTVILEAYRDVLLRGRAPHLLSLGIVALLSLAGCAASWRLFRRVSGDFAERV